MSLYRVWDFPGCSHLETRAGKQYLTFAVGPGAEFKETEKPS